MSAGPTGLYSIAAGRPFLRDLAEGIVARFHAADNPLALSEVTIFLPTRRAARTLGEELVRATGGAALVLPAIRVLGDVDEDALLFLEADEAEIAPEIPRLERALVLARLVDRFRQSTESAGGYPVSLALAQSLARLIDEAANEDVDLSGIAGIAPPDLAVHWAKSVAFLDIATKAWPRHLKEAGKLDPAERRAKAIRAYAKRLKKTGTPFVVAGSSGSIKASADLMKVIAGLPNGAVVLHGLDTTLDGATWDRLIPSHPQFALKELLIYLGIDRRAVGPWTRGDASPTAARRRMLSEAMRPPNTADSWSGEGAMDKESIQRAIQGLSVIEAANEGEEALAIALAIRETLEMPDATVALVTPDRMLARRVASELRRWNIAADDSAGRPLAKTATGVLLRTALEAAASGGQPVSLLAVLKQPDVAIGGDRFDVLRTARQLERRVLRPARVTGGFAAIREAVHERNDDGTSAHHVSAEDERTFAALLGRAETAMRPLSELARGTHDLGAFVSAHAAVLERLTEDAAGKPRIWIGDDGAAAFDLIENLRNAAAQAGQALGLLDYLHAFDTAARDMPVRPQGPRHARVSIWGVLEARLHFADLIILGGMNEGVWPSNPADDPWLSRPMREGLKLSAPERRIGLSAHDFATLAAQPRVLLTRSRRREGAPANPSRFLLRLTALADSVAIPEPDFCRWASQLDGTSDVTPEKRPMPRPPVAARPRKLSVTTIERWLRDPYEIYARHVLRLRKLDALEPALEARHRGDFIHKAAEMFALLPAGQRSDDPYADLLRCGQKAFGGALDDPDVKAFWWPRFERAARWLVDKDAEWAADRAGFIVEERRDLVLPDVNFTLSGQPDRIDRLTDGRIRVIDYKTGQAPSRPQVDAFLAPQLPLLALMAREGAFGKIVEGEAAELIYAQLSGGRVIGKETKFDEGLESLIGGVAARLRALIGMYDDPERPYPSRVGVQSTRHEGDFDHLARVHEWSETLEMDLP